MWVLMLWPLFVGIVYPIARKPRVSNVPALAVLSIVVGYVAMFGMFKLSEAASQAPVDLWLLWLALLLITPPLATHLFFSANARSDEAE